MTLLFSLILLFQACDWFGGEDDKPQKKSSEFVFTVDTLKQFSQFEVNDLDVIDDTSFVVTGFFVENYENGNTKNVYNQIWWGKKKGYEYKTEKFLVDENYYLESARLEYFAGDHNYYAFGIGPSVVINDKNVIKYLTFYSTNSDIDKLQYQNIELIRPGEFYLYGRNGSLVYYKDGRFTKIAVSDSVDLIRAHWATDTLAIWGYKKNSDGDYFENQLFSVTNKTNVQLIKTWNLSIAVDQPFYIYEIIKDQGQWQFLSQRGGLYDFSFHTNTFKRVWGDWFVSASINERNDFIGILLEGTVGYFSNNTLYPIYKFDPEDPFSFPTRAKYKGNLVLFQHYQRIFIGVRK